MDHKAFTEIAVSIYGKSGWQKQLAHDLDKHQSTVSLYATGKATIPTAVALAMEGLKARKEAGK